MTQEIELTEADVTFEDDTIIELTDADLLECADGCDLAVEEVAAALRHTGDQLTGLLECRGKAIDEGELVRALMALDTAQMAATRAFRS